MDKKLIIGISAGVLIGVIVFSFVPIKDRGMEAKIDNVQKSIEEQANFVTQVQTDQIDQTDQTDQVEQEIFTGFENDLDQRLALLDGRENATSDNIDYTSMNNGGITYSVDSPVLLSDFANSLTYDMFDLSWYKEITYQDRVSSDSKRLLLEDDGTWTSVLNFIVENKGTNSIIVFRNLKFLRYLDESRTCCICAFDNTSDSTTENLVILKDIYSSTPECNEGDNVNYAVYVDNIRLQGVAGNDIMLGIYSSNPYIS